MRRLTCRRVGERLAAYHDGELAMVEQIAVAAHLEQCQACRQEAWRLARLGTSLRAAARLVDDTDRLVGLAPGIVARIHAEQEQSASARVGRMFEDMHLVWAGLAASVSTAVSAVLLVGILALCPPERADSLAGIISALASPGSDRNPVLIDQWIVMPRVAAPLASDVLAGQETANDEVEFTLAAVVTQEGRVVAPSVVNASPADRETVARVMSAVAETRFTPASYGGSPVAVNLVWLFAHTTVRGKVVG